MAKNRSKTQSKSAGRNGIVVDSDRRKFRWQSWLLAMMVGAMAFAVFFPAMRNDFVDWDDTDNFIRNQYIRGLSWENIQWMFSTFHMGHFQPLTWLTIGFDSVWGGWAFGPHVVHGYGMDPRSFHLTNIVLHSLNAMLMFFITVRLIRAARGSPDDHSRSGSSALVGAAIAAAFFALHPLRVESVAWATERRDLLSGLFVMLTVLCYLRANGGKEPHRTRWMALSLMFFAISLLSKVIGVTLPVALLILDWYPLRRIQFTDRHWLDRGNVRAVLEKIPFFVLSAVFSLIATLGQGRNNWLVTLEMHGPAARVVQSFYGLSFYVWKTIWPDDLLPLYAASFPLNLQEARFVLAIVAVVGIASFAVIMRKRWPWLLASALIYSITLAPVLGLIQNGQQLVADRYSYLACIPWAVILGGVAAHAWSSRHAIARGAVAAGGIAVIAAISILTRHQIAVWRDTASLWTYMYRHDPSSGFVQNGYGFVLLQQNRFDEAVRVLRSAIETYPQNVKAHQNLWIALRKQPDMAGLVAAYQYAMTLEPVRPSAQSEYGALLLEQGDVPGSAAMLKQAVQGDPANSKAGTNLGVALLRQGLREDAIRELRRVVSVDPAHFPARYNLGLALRSNGQTVEAIEQLRIATQIRPDHEGARNALQQLTNPQP